MSKLYSTLEEQPPNGEDFLEEESDDDNRDGSYFKFSNASFMPITRTGVPDSDDVGLMSTYKMGGAHRLISRVRRFFLGRLFKINHVLLDHQALNRNLYHLMILCEFIQQLFYVFYKVEIINEFYHGGATTTSAVDSTNSTTDVIPGQIQQNITNNTNTNNLGGVVITSQPPVSASTSLSDISIEDPTVIRIESYFEFVNFQLYSLSSNGKDNFTILYAILVGGFYLSLILMYMLAEPLYKAQKREELKDGARMLIRLFSVILGSYLFIFQIPTVMILV